MHNNYETCVYILYGQTGKQAIRVFSKRRRYQPQNSILIWTLTENDQSKKKTYGMEGIKFEIHYIT